METKQASHKAFFTILAIGFLDNLSVGILLPLVPLLLTSRSSGISILPSHFTDAQGYIIYGFLLAVYTIAQFLSTPLLGTLSDKHGRRSILALSIAGTSLAYFLFGYGVFIRNIPLLFFARILDGATGGNISVAQAVIADVTEAKDRTKMYGRFGAALGVGFAIGPMIGAFFSNSHIASWFNATTPFWVTGSLAALCVILILLALPETLASDKRATTLSTVNPVALIIDAFKSKEDRSLFTAIFTWRTGFSFWTTFAVVFFVYRYHVSTSQLGHYFLAVGATQIFCQLVLVPLFSKYLTKIQAVYISVFVTALIFPTYYLMHQWQTLFYLVPILANFTALTFANLPAVVSDAANQGNQGKYSGMSNSVQALGLSIAPILSGFISSRLTPVSIIFISSGLMLIAGIIFVAYQKHIRAKQAL